MIRQSIIFIAVLFACDRKTVTIENIIKQDSLPSSNIETVANFDYIDSLVNIFNIDEFIRVTSNLNSGVSNKKYPDTIGYFYTLYQPIPFDYDEENRENPQWFKMTVFKIGKDTKEFFQQKGILVEIESFSEDKNLSSLNLIGQKIEPFIEFYNLSIFDPDTVKIETDKYRLLINLKNQNEIDYYKLIRISNFK